MITGKVIDTGLKGLTSTLSDYDCGDGELQVCHNILNDGAGLRPIAAAEAMDEIGAGYSLVFVHHTETGEVYITAKDGTNALYWWLDGVATAIDGAAWWDGCQVTNVGNVLVLTGEDGTPYYILWQGKASGYYYLGSKLPELKMEFTLKLSRKDKKNNYATVARVDTPDGIPTMADADESQRVQYGSIDLDEEGNNLTVFDELDLEKWEGTIKDIRTPPSVLEGFKADVADSFNGVMGTVNRMVSEAKDENLFTHAFFVRYAYELYDGTTCMHSAPILMETSTEVNPVIFCREVSNKWSCDGTTTTNCKPRWIKYYAQLICGQLRTRVKNRDVLKGWKDMISHVNIYVSPQVLPYAPDGRKMLIENSYRMNAASVYNIGYRETSVPKFTNKIATADLVSLDDTGSIDETKKVGYIYLPELTETSYKKEIEDTYNFHLLKQYTLDELDEMYQGSWYDVDFTKGALKSIETAETLKDDYHTHDTISAKVLNTYNNRLNKANCALTPFTDMPGEWLSCYTGDEDETSYEYCADVYIKENNVKVKVSTTSVKRMLMSGYFYYPNPNAYLMVISRSDGKYCSVKLEKHPYLFGAFRYYDDFLSESDGLYWQDAAVGDTEVTEGVTSFNYPNYMYTSEVDNPFIFPAEGLNAVGTGEILTIKSATKAMSQGSAFGTNPLYVFCTDGIWALEVGETGVFSAKQPISRETLINHDPMAATQIDNSILFLSERGLMEVVGGQTRLLSSDMQAQHASLDVTALKYWTQVAHRFGLTAWKEADDFMTFIKGARIAYDYSTGTVFVFKPYTEDDADSAVAYVYSAGSKMWGTMDSRMKSLVEDGATTYVNADEDGATRAMRYVMDGRQLVNDGMGMMTTRPMKIGAPDTLKTIRTLVARGKTKNTRFMGMWGSRDMDLWAPIGVVQGMKMPRISGTPYKYIIVGLWAQLPVESGAISKLTMDVVAKYTNKIR